MTATKACRSSARNSRWRSISCNGSKTSRLASSRASRQQDERTLVGPAWQEEDLVFTNAQGGPLRANHILQRQFTPLLKQAGLPLIRFHDLRHTAATLMLRQGIHPKIVAGMLGHSTVSMTLDIYSHVIPDMQRGATEALDRLLGNAESAEAIAPADGRPAGITGKMTRPREGAKRGQNARRERKATMEGDNGDRGHTARSDCADRGLMSELMSKSLQ